VANKILAEKVRKRIIARNSTIDERAAAAAVLAAMKAKTKIGMGMKMKVKTKVKTKKKKMKKRVLPTANCGGILPILPMLGALGSLIGGAADVAKATATAKPYDANLRSCSVTIARWKVMDCILLHTNMERHYISARTNVDRV